MNKENLPSEFSDKKSASKKRALYPLLALLSAAAAAIFILSPLEQTEIQQKHSPLVTVQSVNAESQTLNDIELFGHQKIDFLRTRLRCFSS